MDKEGRQRAADFVRHTNLPVRSIKISVTGGAACKQSGQTVRIVNVCKCKATVRKGKAKVPIVITVYSGSPLPWAVSAEGDCPRSGARWPSAPKTPGPGP